MQRENKKINKIDGRNLKIAIIVSKFNVDITEKMLQGALEVLRINKVKKNNIEIVWVPGAYEIPLACQKLAKEKKYDGLVAIGCVIKGDTDHYYYISQEVSRGIMDVMLKFYKVLPNSNIEVGEFTPSPGKVYIGLPKEMRGIPEDKIVTRIEADDELVYGYGKGLWIAKY